MSGEKDFEPVRIEPTNKKATIEFVGIERGFASSAREGVSRWTEMTLYETESGKWIVETIGCSDNEGEIDYVDYMVFRNKDRMINRLDFNQLVQDLYSQAGINEVRIL